MKYTGINNDPWTRSTVTFGHVWWDNGFSNEELAKITDYCERDELQRATIMGDNEKINEVRRCNIRFVRRDEETGWFFDRMNNIITNLNDQFYGMELNGYDAFQFTSYDAAEAGTYHWHMDICMGAKALPAGMTQPRKLSLSLLLNDDFEGGEFMFNLGNEKNAIKVDIPKGRVLAFPSYMIHSVRPVTKGFRKSIVIWVVGPKFR